MLDYLLKIPGVARKTALCIMLYSLGRQALPVDTHVWRVSRRLGWVGPKAKPSIRDEMMLESLVHGKAPILDPRQYGRSWTDYLRSVQPTLRRLRTGRPLPES